MSVRKRSWTNARGEVRSKWMIHVKFTHADGRVQTVRKVSPVQTRRGAERYEREVRTALLEGSYGKRSTNKEEEQEVPTLSGFAEEFLAHQASPAAHRLRGANRPGELREKKRTLDNHLIPALGNKRLDEIDARAIDRYTASKQRTGLSPSTITNHLIVLKRMLNVAKRWDIIDRVPEIATPKKPNRIQFLEFLEAKELVDAAPTQWRPWFLLAMRTGLRLGEMRALRWRHVDLVGRSLRVVDNLTNAGFGETKSGRARVVPLAIDAAQVLSAWKPAEAKPSDFVFVGRFGGPRSAMGIHKALNKAAIAAGIKKPHRRKDKSHSGVTPHLLRHTFASHAVIRNVPLRQVQEWMGHASISQTVRYSHLAPTGQHELADRLSS